MKTVSLELSKQLRESGYPQESYWFWYLGTNPELIHFDYHDTERANDYRTESTKSDKREYVYYASPTADEILDLLPRSVGGVCWRVGPTLAKIGSITIEYGDSKDCQHGDSLVDAAAKMWLYLKRGRLI